MPFARRRGRGMERGLGHSHMLVRHVRPCCDVQVRQHLDAVHARVLLQYALQSLHARQGCEPFVGGSDIGGRAGGGANDALATGGARTEEAKWGSRRAHNESNDLEADGVGERSLGGKSRAFHRLVDVPTWFRPQLGQITLQTPDRGSRAPNRPNHVASMVITVPANAFGIRRLPEPPSHPRHCARQQKHQQACRRHVVVAFQETLADACSSSRRTTPGRALDQDQVPAMHNAVTTGAVPRRLIATKNTDNTYVSSTPRKVAACFSVFWAVGDWLTKSRIILCSAPQQNWMVIVLLFLCCASSFVLHFWSLTALSFSLFIFLSAFFTSPDHNIHHQPAQP